MSNLEEFLNNKLPEDQDDLFMEKITKLRMDGKKKEYEQKLKTSYGVSKDINRGKSINRTLLVFVLVAIAVALLYFSFATNLFLDNADNINRNIASYIQDNKIHNYDIIRGGATTDAYNEYELGNYDEAIAVWERQEMNLQDSFYLAMSNLHAGHYSQAETNLSDLNKLIESGDKYYPELQLYRTLILNLLNDIDGASKIYESWPIDSWMSKEYRDIMNLKD